MFEGYSTARMTLKDRGSFHPDTGYTLIEVSKNILVAVNERTGKPMVYPVPFGRQTPGSTYSYVLDTIFRQTISQALQLDGWKAIDDYNGIKTGPRQLTREQTEFLFNLIKQRFENDTPERERHLSAIHLWKSGLSPEILDYTYSFMFPPVENHFTV